MWGKNSPEQLFFVLFLLQCLSYSSYSLGWVSEWMSSKEFEFPPLYRLLKVEVAPQNRSTSQLPTDLYLNGILTLLMTKIIFFTSCNVPNGVFNLWQWHFWLLDLRQTVEALNGCLTSKIKDLEHETHAPIIIIIIISFYFRIYKNQSTFHIYEDRT